MSYRHPASSFTLSWTCFRPGSSKVLTVQVVTSELLQSEHFRYCRSPLTRFWVAPQGKTELSLQGALLVCSQLFLLPSLCKSMQSSLHLRHTEVHSCFLLLRALKNTWKSLECLQAQEKSCSPVCSQLRCLCYVNTAFEVAVFYQMSPESRFISVAH